MLFSHLIIYNNNNNKRNNVKSWKGADLKQTKSRCDHWSQSTDYLHSPHTVTTHGLVAFQASDVWFRSQLFGTGTASGSVSAAAAVVVSAAAHLIHTFYFTT